MNVSLPQSQHTFINDLVATGRFDSADEAVSEGLRLLASQEKLREQIQVGIDQADRGELRDHDEVFQSIRQRVREVGGQASS